MRYTVLTDDDVRRVLPMSAAVDRIESALREHAEVTMLAPPRYRVDVDIVGYGQSDGEDNENQATSVLLPVATRAEVDLTLSRVLPGLDLAGIPLHAPPRRARSRQESQGAEIGAARGSAPLPPGSP